MQKTDFNLQNPASNLKRAERSKAPPACPGNLAAFTLIEVLLAISIFSMVLISLYSSWSSVMRGTKAAQTAAVAVQRSRMAVRAIEEALSTAQIYASNPKLYGFIADTKGEFATLDVTCKLPETFPGSGLYGDMNLRRVRFVVESDNVWRNKLVLYQIPVLSPDPENEKFEIVLGRDVDLFKLEFWDPIKKDWVDEWKQTNSFPTLVEVRIGMGSGPNVPQNEREIITRVIAPPCIVVPMEYQRPGVPRGGPLPPGIAPPPITPGQPGGGLPILQ